MERVSVNQLVEGLCAIPDESFVCDHVYNYLGHNPVDIDSIGKYMFWSSECYTRNLIYKDERFEMMAICWERGQASRVHNHFDQRCWMMVPLGRLKGQNFAMDEFVEGTGYCKLRETDVFELSDCVAAKVELEEPIQHVLNLA